MRCPCLHLFTFNLAGGTSGLCGVLLQYLVHRNDVGVRVEKDGLQRGIGACPSQDGHYSTGTHLRHRDSTFIIFIIQCIRLDLIHFYRFK